MPEALFFFASSPLIPLQLALQTFEQSPPSRYLCATHWPQIVWIGLDWIGLDWIGLQERFLNLQSSAIGTQRRHELRIKSLNERALFDLPHCEYYSVQYGKPQSHPIPSHSIPISTTSTPPSIRSRCCPSSSVDGAIVWLTFFATVVVACIVDSLRVTKVVVLSPSELDTEPFLPVRWLPHRRMSLVSIIGSARK